MPFPVGLIDTIAAVRHGNVAPRGYADFSSGSWPIRHDAHATSVYGYSSNPAPLRGHLWFNEKHLALVQREAFGIRRGASAARKQKGGWKPPSNCVAAYVLAAALRLDEAVRAFVRHSAEKLAGHVRMPLRGRTAGLTLRTQAPRGAMDGERETLKWTSTALDAISGCDELAPLRPRPKKAPRSLRNANHAT